MYCIVTMSWGSGMFGQLGHGPDRLVCSEPTVIDRLMPQFVGGDVVSVHAGGMNSAVIVTSNVLAWKQRRRRRDQRVETQVFRFGSNKFQQCAIGDVSGGTSSRDGSSSNVVVVPTPMVEVLHPETGEKVFFYDLALGRIHSVGVCANGELYSWGFTPRCGHGGRGSSNTVKSALTSKSGTMAPRRIGTLRGIRIVQVVAGDAHTLALSDNGVLYSWGCGSDGQLGHGNEFDALIPKQILLLQFKRNDVSPTNNGMVTARIDDCTDLNSAENPNRSIMIDAAGNYSAMVTQSGDLFTWGSDADGQLGHKPCGESDKYAQLKGNSIHDLQSFQFDSTPSVQIPRRVECLRDNDLEVKDLSLGMQFMLLLCNHRNVDP